MESGTTFRPRPEAILVLGLNSAYHESSACLICNGRVVAAAEEERFNRVRHGKRATLTNPHELPVQAIRYCLEAAGITAADLDLIGYSISPDKRLAFNVGLDEETTPGLAGTAEGEGLFHRLLLLIPQRLSSLLGEDVSRKFRWIDHHLCHAASVFFVSPFDEAAVLSVDGIGESTSTWMGIGRGNHIEACREIRYPNSLGFLWTKLSRFLGFGPYGQWKVMGLAGYGDSDRYYQAFRKFVDYDNSGGFAVDSRTLQYRVDKYDALERLFGPRRAPEDHIDGRHEDIAAALQRVTNEALFSLAAFLKERTGMKRLCLAGGVALNCVANGLLVDQGPFDEVFIQPAANDAGTALGACFYLWNQVLGNHRAAALDHVYLGPEFAEASSDEPLCGEGFVPVGADGLESAVARLIARGEVVAWFQGRMEFGPRALGNRSILADPRRAEIVHCINDRIKHREYFRPFAASVLDEYASAWFEVGRPCPSDAFMLCARKVRQDRLGSIPAVTHVDGTCRLQRVCRDTNPRYHRLISEFKRLTGVPLVLNTSFNDSEPIICRPRDAVNTCRKAGIRYLAVGDRLVDFQAGRPGFGKTLAYSNPVGTEVRRGQDDGGLALADSNTSTAVESPEVTVSALERILGHLTDAERAALQQSVKIAFRSR